MKRRGLVVLAELFGLSAAVSLAGCSDIPLLNPKGPIGASELSVIVIAFVLMLIVVVPVTGMAIWFSFRYSASGAKGSYDPKWSSSAMIHFVVWLVPAAIVTALGILAWRETHRLDPFRPINSTIRPIDIEVVSLDWKWLFIYPEQNFATVNQLVFPANVPVRFTVTSDTVMTSFFIPQLGSQIYAMAGMQSRLHLLASEPGVYFGQNQQFSGRGYSDMHFRVEVTSPKQFETWIQTIRQSPDKLDFVRLETLSKPTIAVPVASFSAVEPGLFYAIVHKYHARELSQLPVKRSLRASEIN